MKLRLILLSVLMACAMHGTVSAAAGQQPFPDGHASRSDDLAEPLSCAAGTVSSAYDGAPEADTYAVYRVSRRNADEILAALPGIASRSGEDSATYRYFDLIAGQMADVLASGGGLLDDRNALHQVFGLVAEATDAEQEPLFVDRVRFMSGAECSRTCLRASELLLCDVAHASTTASRLV